MLRSLAALFDERHAAVPSSAVVGWYAGHIPPGSGPALDAACGTGRLLVALLERGCNVHGAEHDPDALAEAQRRVTDAGYTAPVFRQPLTGLNLPFRYGMAFVAGGRLQALARRAEMTTALERLRMHLTDPGVLLLELLVPPEAEHPPGAPVVEVERLQCADGACITVRREVTVDVGSRRIERRERYERRAGGEIAAREDQRVLRTWLLEDEALRLLTAAGFATVQLEAVPTEESRSPAGRRFAVVATT